MSDLRMLYVTLNSVDEARRIGRRLLEGRLANCVNWFPITCMYNWEGTITEEPEVVLIVKTKAGRYPEIEQVIKSEISYTNCIAEIEVNQNTSEFVAWLDGIVGQGVTG
jgi:periplasmic divalent cation tolerance protein